MIIYIWRFSAPIYSLRIFAIIFHARRLPSVWL